MTNVGRIDLKLERTDQNWDEFVWDKLNLERVLLYPNQPMMIADTLFNCPINVLVVAESEIEHCLHLDEKKERPLSQIVL